MGLVSALLSMHNLLLSAVMFRLLHPKAIRLLGCSFVLRIRLHLPQATAET